MLTDLTDRLAAKKLTPIYMAESGSRAWGFPSPDSDYDVRFIFAHPIDHYLSLDADNLSDIQYKKNDHDFAGWELRKALRLAYNSNPSLIEWINSPIRYFEHGSFRNELYHLLHEHVSPCRLAHHYLNFMRNIRGKYLSDFTGEYTLKRYFYALRPIFAILWMSANNYEIPPVNFHNLIPPNLDPALRTEIDQMLALKAQGNNATNYESSTVDAYIKSWYDSGHIAAAQFPVRHFPIEPLNDLFRRTLRSII